MTSFLAEVKVWLKPSVFDPQGNAIEQSLHTLGHQGVSSVRMGKNITFTVTAETEAAAEQTVDTVCRELLCNLVIETYTFTLTKQPVGAGA